MISRLCDQTRFHGLRLAFCLIWLVAHASRVRADAPTFELRFDQSLRSRPYTGQVTIFFGKSNQEPRFGPNWFHPEPFVTKHVTDWKPDEPLTISLSAPDLATFPRSLDSIQWTDFKAQAVARWNPWEREVGTGTGNAYSDVVELTKDNLDKVVLRLTKTVPERPWPDSKWTKLLRVHSELLSDFHRKDVFLRAAVILPDSYYNQPQRRYPTIFNIPGFGGTHRHGYRNRPVKEDNPEGVEFIRVMLDPSCPLGHHVFADSANNGPFGTALVQEFLPAFDREFRTIAKPTARFLTGHSSGGWSSLWVQITHPDTFGGVWSTAPDPVDFRNFQRINLYQQGENMYRDADGKRRPLARRNGEVLVWYRDFADMEDTLGPGGQLHSFEAVFSPRTAAETPALLWDRETGEINSDVANAWKKYDIRLYLERNWDKLNEKLAGKIHVFMGEEDTFYLEGATKRLKESLKNLGSDAVVELHPGKDHGTLMSQELRQRIRKEMAEQFLQHHSVKSGSPQP
ncbi:alpha/beta hydrolase-fold protein [Thalassoroseus pseudoceratinae]|uniref:alpha/beta hydrolase-fold protein n=1 Tax=Thalassoroseus pseudoceratinae TaxID=2713176 RepID=UPI00142414A5|nr:alpha/beta hydrolase-fold protein [Thalassoroseus pseudoceratinae]